MRRHSEGNQKARLVRKAPAIMSIGMALALAGCSMIPDMPDMPDMPNVPNWVNPVSWFDGLWTGDDDAQTLPKSSVVSTPSKEKSFPKLGDTPKLERQPRLRNVTK